MHELEGELWVLLGRGAENRRNHKRRVAGFGGPLTLISCLFQRCDYLAHLIQLWIICVSFLRFFFQVFDLLLSLIYFCLWFEVKIAEFSRTPEDFLKKYDELKSKNTRNLDPLVYLLSKLTEDKEVSFLPLLHHHTCFGDIGNTPQCLHRVLKEPGVQVKPLLHIISLLLLTGSCTSWRQHFEGMWWNVGLSILKEYL